MSKWRPILDRGCIYVIPDIHGQIFNLKLLTDRIFPLRFSEGIVDMAIFLGDYIDRDVNSHLVVDHLIELKNKYPDQTVFLKGNHEQMLINAIEPSINSDLYLEWMRNGGAETLTGYSDRAGRSVGNPYAISRQRVSDYIPIEHLEFFKTLIPVYETDDFIFVHGGIDPLRRVSSQRESDLIWDRELHYFVLNGLKFKPAPWNKTIICGHNTNAEGIPTIRSKYMMLDTSAAKQILMVELNSLEAFVAKSGTKKLVKFDLEEM